MGATQTANTPSFDTVWALLQEVGEKQRETALQMQETDRRMQETDRQMQETERLIKERQQETDRQMQETDRRMQEADRRMQETERLIKEKQMETDRVVQETSRQIKDMNKQYGELNNRFGEIVEYMVMPKLCDKMNEFGFDFLQANSGTRVRDHKNNIYFEVDILLENGDKAMLVEVKNKPTTEQVQEHIGRLEKMRKYADLKGDRRSFLGAVAGVVMTDNVRDYVLKQGLFVIEPSGESFNITPPDNKPREW